MRWPRRFAATRATMTVSSDARPNQSAALANALRCLASQHHDEGLGPATGTGGERQRRPGKSAGGRSPAGPDEERRKVDQLSSWLTTARLATSPSDRRTGCRTSHRV